MTDAEIIAKMHEQWMIKLRETHRQVCEAVGDHPEEIDTAYSFGADCIRRVKHLEAELAKLKSDGLVQTHYHMTAEDVEAFAKSVEQASKAMNEGDSTTDARNIARAKEAIRGNLKPTGMPTKQEADALLAIAEQFADLLKTAWHNNSDLGHDWDVKAEKTLATFYNSGVLDNG